METASLRIKFTPLFNNALKNGSKCCLEIVPEISYVQNLENISWKQEKDLIEYTIPMTYKVILKRRDNQKDFKGVMAFKEFELDKTYHSCVDLLPPSSMTAFDFASGDVTGMISDTYIFGKISAKIDDDKNKFNNPIPIYDQVAELNKNNTIIELPIEKNTTEEQTVIDVQAKPTEKHNTEFADPVVMDNDSVVAQIVNSLSFEVQAVPQDNVLQLTTTTKAAPLNVKIRVRKKEEAVFSSGIIALPYKPNQPESSVPERIRLVSSDQTLMSFNIIMEADFGQPSKKHRGILGFFKPTSCLGSQPHDEHYAYSPSTVTYQAKLDSSNSKSDGALTKFTLFKNVDYEKSAPRKKGFFGRYKPGGCLDPPFAEDSLPYLPEIVNEQSTSEKKSNGQNKTSSIFSNKIFNKKKKSYDIETLENNVIPIGVKVASVIKIHQSDSQEGYSNNSIMTYPPTLNSSVQQEEKRVSRTGTDQFKLSFSEHSGSYFIIPKKQKNLLDKNIYGKKEYEKDIINLSATLDRNSRESSDTKQSVTYQHFTEITDTDNIKEINSLKCLVPDNTENMVLIPIEPINQFENDTQLKKTQEESSLLTGKQISTCSNELKIHTSSDCNRDSLLQIDNLDSNTNKSMDTHLTPEQMLENKPANKGIVTIAAKHEISQKHLNEVFPLLNKRKSSEKITGNAPSLIINQEDDHLQYLWKNQNVPTISEINFQQEPELDNQTNTTNETLYNVKDIKKSKQVSKISIFSNDVVTKEPDYIVPKNIIDNLYSRKDPSLEGIITNIFLETTTNKNNSIEEPKLLDSSRITQLKASVDQFKDVSSDQQEKLVDEPTSSIISSSKSLNTSDQTNEANIEVASTGNKDSLNLNQQLLKLAIEKSPKTSYSSNLHSEPAKQKIFKIVKLNEINTAEEVNKNDTLGFVPQDIKLDLNRQQNNMDNIEAIADVNSLNLNQQERILELETKFTPEISNSINSIIQPEQLNLYEMDKLEQIRSEEDVNEKKTLGFKQNDSNLELANERTSSMIYPTKSSMESEHNKMTNIEATAEENKDYLNLYPQERLLEQTTESSKYSSHSFIQSEQQNINEIKELSQIKAVEGENKHILGLAQQRSVLEIAKPSPKTKSPSNSIVASNQKNIASINDFTKPTFKNVRLIKNNQSKDKDETLLFLENDNAVESRNSSKINSEDNLLNTLEDQDPYKYDDRNEKVHESDYLNAEENCEQDVSKPEFESGTHSSSERISHSNSTEDAKSCMKDEKTSQNLNELLPDKNETKTSLIIYDEVLKMEDTKNYSSNNEFRIKEGDVPRKMDTSFKIIENEIESLFTLTESYKPNAHITDIIQQNTFENTALHENESLVDDSTISKTTYQNNPNHGNNENNGAHKNKTNGKITTSFEPGRESIGVIFLNLAIQSYVDDMNQTLVKSFDTESIPMRYPGDFIKVTKRHLKIDDNIQIPIDADNYMDIQIKNNKLKNIIVSQKPSYNVEKETDKLALSDNMQYLNYSDPIKRNCIIADDIKRTLEVVYEKELLPLRNDILELKDNIKMLMAQHKHVTGHIFMKKTKSTKIIPVYKKCSCSRR